MNAFIMYDIGQLSGPAGQRAYSQFQALQGDEAIPALVRGVNRAARMRQSCPIIVLAGKLQSLLKSAASREMLRYAIENLDSSGSGVVYGSYVDSLREMAERELYGDKRVQQQMRGATGSQLKRINRPIEQWSYEDLQEAIHQEKGARLVQVLEELMKRKGAQYTSTLAEAIAVVPDDAKEVARGLLAQRFVRLKERSLIAKLEDANPEVRAAAVRAVGYKGSPLYEQLSAALRDKPLVAEYAHEVLVKLSGEDFGPGPEAAGMEWYRASKRWEHWAQEQKTSAGQRGQNPKEP